MNDDTIHTLVASTNRGRYALDEPKGQDITSGDRIAIWLAGQWTLGRVEHGGTLYASEASGRAERGYYFVASNGGMCGLCSGMRVRLP
jgi:Domain of unknown function (DUF5348)